MRWTTNDFLAIISLLGSLVLLLEAGSRAGKRRRRPAGKMGEWSVMGLVFGIVGQAAVAETPLKNIGAEPGRRTSWWGSSSACATIW